MNDIHLRDFGSFFVGGGDLTTSGADVEEHVLAKGGVSVAFDPNGETALGQMYVQYALTREDGRPPIAFWHGGSMTGAAWETTPDGRDGWLTQFLRRGWSCYNVDAVERGRSGWNLRDPRFQLPPILRTAQDTFVQFRIGKRTEAMDLPALKAAAYPDTRFPLEYFHDFVKQIVPRWAMTDDLVLDAYCALLNKIGPIVIIAHSQGGAFAFRAAERCPDKVAAIVVVEPAQGGVTDGAALSGIPVLAVYGDHIDRDARWPAIREKTSAYFNSMSAHGVDIEIIDLPTLGISGNSHMLMMETNNEDIASLVESWLQRKLNLTK